VTTYPDTPIKFLTRENEAKDKRIAELEDALEECKNVNAAANMALVMCNAEVERLRMEVRGIHDALLEDTDAE